VRSQASSIRALDLKRWYDGGRDFVMPERLNEWENSVGTFKNALNPQLRPVGKEFRRELFALAD